MNKQPNKTAQAPIAVYTLSVDLCHAAEQLRNSKQPDVIGKVYDSTVLSRLTVAKQPSASRAVSLHQQRVCQWNIPGCNYRVSETGDLLRINSHRATLSPSKLILSETISATDGELIAAGLSQLIGET